MKDALSQESIVLRRTISVLLVVTMATAVVDAVSVLHLGVFTAYVTGTLILFGAKISTGLELEIGSAVALVAFAMGAVLGGRLVRYRSSTHVLADRLAIIAGLIFGAAIIAGFGSSALEKYLTILVLSIAMGGQTAITRYIAIPDMTLPAATMAIHGLAYDSRIAGGQAERRFRRLAVVCALLIGATAGAGVAMWRLWAGLLLAALLLALAATMAYLLLPKNKNNSQ